MFGNVGDWSQDRLRNTIVSWFPQLSAKVVPPSVGSSGSSRLPGELTMWPTASAPAGHVLCDGAEYDPGDGTYAALYAALGTTFNTGGETAGFFRVPDLRGRVPVGLGTHPDVDALGDRDAVALASRTPKHTHSTPASTTAGPTDFILGVPTTKDGAGANTVTPWDLGYDGHTHAVPAGTSGTGNLPFLTVNFIIAL